MKLKEWVKTLIFYEIVLGMKATLSHLLHYKPITLQYPHEKKPLPSILHGHDPVFVLRVVRESMPC